MLYFVFAAILSLINYFSEHYASRIEKYHVQIVSFSAGLFITFIFLDLLPEFFKGVELIGASGFLLLLLGFVVFHTGEKYIYQHIKNRRDLMQDLAAFHVLGFFVDHFIIGMALYLAFLVENIFVGIIIFIPLVLRVFSSSLSLNQIDEHLNMNTFFMLLIAAAPLFGTLFAYFIQPAHTLFYFLLSFILGTLLYIVIRDMIPRDEKGDLRFFIAGFIISLVLILAVRSLV